MSEIRSVFMKKNIVTLGIFAIISILLFSPRSRKAIYKTANGEVLDKAHELKNVLSDWRKNQTSYK